MFKDKIRYHNCPSQKNENKNEWFINYKFENSFSNFSSTKYCEKCLPDDFDFKIALPYIKKKIQNFSSSNSPKKELNNLALKHYCIICMYSFNIHILSSEFKIYVIYQTKNREGVLTGKWLTVTNWGLTGWVPQLVVSRVGIMSRHRSKRVSA